MINPGEFIQIRFKNNGIYAKENYTIEYSYVLTKPDYGASNEYLLYIDDTLGNKIKDEKQYYKKYEYIGKTSAFTLIIRENLTNICNEDFCSLCYESTKSCVTCKYTFDYNKNNNTKTCYNLPTENIEIDISSVPNQYLISDPNNITNILKYTNEEVLSGKFDLELTKEQIQLFYEELKNNKQKMQFFKYLL